MKDWKTLAQAGGSGIPEADLERIIEPLQALEDTFRPLVANLPPELEPATELRAGENDE